MKILMCNRNRDGWVGGDIIQMDATIEALRELGHEVRTADQDDINSMRWCDIMHLWNLGMEWSFYYYSNAKAFNKNVVCSTIYHGLDRFTSYNVQQRIINGLDAVICLCDGEVNRLLSKLNVDLKKVHIIPNGLETYWFDSLPQHNDYLLTVGRLEEFKGQRYVAAVCKKLGIPYVCIGDGEDKELLEQLGATVIPAMPREQLPQYYANCKAYILASQHEVFPMTVMEAAAQDKPIILTDKSCWFPEGAIPCTNGDQLSIKNAIETATGHINVIGMTWEKVAKQLEEVYRCL